MLEFRHTHHPISMNYYKVVLEHSGIKVVSLVFHLKLNGTTNEFVNVSPASLTFIAAS